MRLTRKQSRAIAAMILAGNGSCCARPEHRIQHWIVEFEGRSLRVLYDSVSKRLKSVQANLVPVSIRPIPANSSDLASVGAALATPAA